MPEFMYVLTHLIAVAVGYGWGRYATRRALRTLVHKVDPDNPMEEALVQDERKRKRYDLGLWILIAATVLIGIGVQSFTAQQSAKEANERREANFQCLADWSDQFADALSRRTGYTEQVAAAQKVREDSIDRVLLLVAKAYQNPDAVDDKTARAALDAFVKAQANLAKVRQEQTKAKQDSPYPPPPSEICDN